MKKLAVLIFVFAMSVTSTFANNEDKLKKKKSEVRTEVVKLLGNYDRDLRSNLNTTVSFIINRKNEIVVLSVASKNQSLVSYVKRKLNYKKIKVSALNYMKVYQLPLKVKRV
jgi:hypothetical protein